MKDKSLRPFTELLQVAPKLRHQQGRYRNPATLSHFPVLERSPLRVLVGIQPPVRSGSVGATHDKPPRVVIGRKLDIIPEETGRLTPAESTQGHDKHETLTIPPTRPRSHTPWPVPTTGER